MHPKFCMGHKYWWLLANVRLLTDSVIVFVMKLNNEQKVLCFRHQIDKQWNETGNKFAQSCKKRFYKSTWKKRIYFTDFSVFDTYQLRLISVRWLCLLGYWSILSIRYLCFISTVMLSRGSIQCPNHCMYRSAKQNGLFQDNRSRKALNCWIIPQHWVRIYSPP